jgi:hypothetical protein
MIRVFTRPELIPPGKSPCFMLWPLLATKESDVHSPDYGRFSNYLQQGQTIVSPAASAAECDVVVFPAEYAPEENIKSAVLQLGEEAKAHNKPFIIFYNSDFSDEIVAPGAEIFRTTLKRSTRRKNEHGYPGWSIDFLKFRNNTFTPLPKAKLPRISYCGYIDYSTFSQGLAYKWNSRKRDEMYRVGPELRGNAVRALRKNPRIETDFIIRGGFWAAGETDKIKARTEYAMNMLQSPYALVARGAGNFSYRLYEVLSCGRIPVFLDTDCVLPFDEFMDWKKHMCWINEPAHADISEKLLAFHDSLTEEEFVQLQISNRKLYEDWIRPEAFFRKLELYLRTS